MAEQRNQLVRNDVARRLHRLQNLPEHRQKAVLANLRRGVGRVPGALPELWGIFLQDLPEPLESKTGVPTPGEWAIYLALTLYALHQQGHALPNESMHREGVRFGRAVRGLVREGEMPESSSDAPKKSPISPRKRFLSSLSTTNRANSMAEVLPISLDMLMVEAALTLRPKYSMILGSRVPSMPMDRA